MRSTLPPAFAQATATEARTVDLCGLDYSVRRHLLFDGLRVLTPGQSIQVVDDQGEGLHWLRYELEERMSQRYRWSVNRGRSGTSRTTIQML